MKPRLCIGGGSLLVALVVTMALGPGCALIPATLTDTGESTDRSTSGDSGTASETPFDAGGDVTSSPGVPSTDGGAGTTGTSGDGVSGSTPGSTGGAPSGGSTNGDTQSGTLTAGSFDDNLNLDAFRSFVSDAQQADSTAQLPGVSLGQRMIVTVQDPNGGPVLDARVTITPANQSARAAFERTSGSDGRVLFLSGLDDSSGATTFSVSVQPPDGSAAVVGTYEPNNPQWTITLPSAVATLPTKLDLAFLIDCTGSMSDELEYLKTEVRSIAEAVHELFPTVAQRYALIVYRDQGDIYVVKPFAFTASLDEFVANLAAQSANGGGDEPEAVHLALEEVAKLVWTPTDTARVLFWIADAPPHSEFGQRAFDAVQTLRGQNIAIYPVAASGAGTTLEYYMRASAFLTLSEYLFLTDDSGVGNPHATPHIPCYQVQRLDQLMIRMVRAELSGTRVEPDPADVIRTVGQPVAGVCAAEGQGS